MKWFKNWLFNSMKQVGIDREKIAYDNQKIGSNNPYYSTSESEGGPLNQFNSDKSIQFTVYFANGGRIVETVRHTKHQDRVSSGLYIISNDNNFGNELDKIITMESLK